MSETPGLLEKQTDFAEKPRAITSFFLSLILFGMAAMFFFGVEDIIFKVAAAVPALVGLLLFLNGFHALFASVNPPAVMILPSQPLVRSTPTELRLRQQGPISLESLRVNLICEKSTRKGKQRQLTYPIQDNIFASGPYEISLEDSQTSSFHVTVPADAEPSGDTGHIRIVWRLEVWGKVNNRADFMRPFAIEVV